MAALDEFLIDGIVASATEVAEALAACLVTMDGGPPMAAGAGAVFLRRRG